MKNRLNSHYEINMPETPDDMNSLRWALAHGIELFEEVLRRKADIIPPLLESGAALVRHLTDEVKQGSKGLVILTRHALPVVAAHAIMKAGGTTTTALLTATSAVAAQLEFMRLALAGTLVANSESDIAQAVGFKAVFDRLASVATGGRVLIESRIMTDEELRQLRAVAAAKQLTLTLFCSAGEDSTNHGPRAGA